MKKLNGKIFSAALLMLVLGACGPEQESSTAEPADEQAAEESKELNMIELPKARTAEPGEAISYGFTADKSSGAMTSFLELALNDIHNFWAELMVQGGHDMPFVDYILTYDGETEATDCTAAGSTGPDDAFYCAEEDLIVFANELAMDLWESEAASNGDPETGAADANFAVVAALSHLYSHSLQGEWGWLPAEADQERLAAVKGTELNAECLTGVWAQSAYGSDMLEAGAVESTMERLSGVGQHDLAEDKDHGTPEERADAFMTGFESAMANSCDAYLGNGDASAQ